MNAIPFYMFSGQNVVKGYIMLPIHLLLKYLCRETPYGTLIYWLLKQDNRSYFLTIEKGIIFTYFDSSYPETGATEYGKLYKLSLLCLIICYNSNVEY